MGFVLGGLMVACVGVGIFAFISLRKDSKKSSGGRSTSRQTRRS